MTTFTLTLDLSSLYVTDAPSLEILIDGEVVSSFLVTSSYTPTDYTFSSASSVPNISFRFNDSSSETNRSISINNVEINGVPVAPSSLDQSTLNQGDTSNVDVVAEQSSFNAEPDIADFGGATKVGTSGDDLNLISDSDPNNIDVIDALEGNDIVRGRNQDDVLFLGDGDDRAYAQGGNDRIIGGAGFDLIFGGVGDDEVWGGDGDDKITGDAGNDTLHGGAGDDVLKGKDGDDLMNGGAGNDSFQSDDGNDIAYGDAGNDRLFGGNGDDILYGGDGDDFIDGNADSDYLYGGAGKDRVEGGFGDDFIDGGAGNDFLEGEDGYDTALYDGDWADYNFTVNGAGYLMFDSRNGDTDVVVSFENFVFNDVTKAVEDVINLRPTITSDGGSDTAVVNMVENTTLVTTVTATDSETASNNIVYSISGGLNSGLFTIDSVTGELSFANAPDYELLLGNGDNVYDVEVKALDSDGKFDTQTLSVNVTNAAEADVGSGVLDTGILGNSVIDTGTINIGDSIIYDVEASGDRDWFGVDLVAGQSYVVNAHGTATEAGTNVDPHIFNIHSTLEGVSALLGLGADDSGIDTNADIGSDSLIYFTPTTSGTYYIDAGGFNNATGEAVLSIDIAGSNITGSGVVNGTSGVDFLEGSASNDTLQGNDGDDVLYGDAGDDILNGGDGDDVLYGGTGADIFMISALGSSDAVVDFNAAEGDMLDISNIIENYETGDAIADYLQFTETSDSTIVRVDTNGKIGHENFVEVATLEGNLGEDMQALFSNGNIII